MEIQKFDKDFLLLNGFRKTGKTETYSVSFKNDSELKYSILKIRICKNDENRLGITKEYTYKMYIFNHCFKYEKKICKKNVLEALRKFFDCYFRIFKATSLGEECSKFVKRITQEESNEN